VTFADESKWKLPSGSTVEDTLYNYFTLKGSRPTSEVSNAILNWIVMVDSKEMEDLFPEADDWLAILEQVKPLPRVSNTVLSRLAPFYSVHISEDTLRFYPVSVMRLLFASLLTRASR
jgi:hypothetical protein